MCFSDELVERLFEAGCNDGTSVSRDGAAYVVFAREASSLEDAIRSVIADIARAGQRVQRVEIEGDDLEELGHAAAAQSA